jgi:hypothetical protein
MKDEEFEDKLQSLTSALHRPDPTPAWKADILGRALREADVVRPKRALPPRWLMVTWGTAWAAIVVLNLAAPQTPVQSGSSQGIATAPDTKPPASETLMAYNRQLNRTLNLDLP